MDTAITLKQLLENEEIMDFVQRNVDLYLPKESFGELVIPRGLSVEDAWNLLAFLRHTNARPSRCSSDAHAPAAALRPSKYWWYWNLTCITNEKLYRIESMASDRAALWESLRKPHQTPIVQDAVSLDIQAALVREGVYSEGCSLLREEGEASIPAKSPATTTSSSVDSAKRELLTLLFKESNQDHQDRIEELISLGQAVIRNHPDPVRPVRKDASPDFPASYHDEREALQEIGKNFEQPTRMGFHPIATMLMNSDIIWHSRPFGPGSALVEVLLRYYFLSLHHLPVLALVPISHLRLQWETADEPSPEIPWPFGQAHIITRFGTDGTPYLNTMIGLWERGLCSLDQKAAARNDQHAARVDLVSKDWRLNHRQQNFLLASPANTKGTDVASYGARFDIALATARSDLLKLVKLGYMNTTFEGKRQVFWVKE